MVVEAALLVEDGKRFPSLFWPPCWWRMESAPHRCFGRLPRGGSMVVSAALLAENEERSML
jgi:hypothetical protein